MPGWTWIDEDDASVTEEEIDKRTPTLDMLAERITAMRDQAERQQWARQARYEDGDCGPEYDTAEEADAAEHQAAERRRIDCAIMEAQENVILEEMHRLGARMMRPYEHWNEDERYMQYQESDRFGDSGY